ncbi:MAG TPA: hypothetical protein PK593_05680 [Thermomicrobiales bacterium]|nr:hypothetical protein [Thermomicrobiales bacterium]HQZ90980.1 hypothetical protein [Thermomicrobiales bacterium]HRA32051.1 hypothetical protein [Thermomicrobiales bacterium]
MVSSARKPARGYRRVTRELHLAPVLVALVLLVAGCRIGSPPTPTPPISASPTETLTPAGDVLRINGVPVRRIVIPSASIGPIFALAADTLYRMEKGTWTPIGNDRLGRHYLVDPEDLERVFRGRHRVCGGSPPEPDVPMEESKDGGLHWRQLTLGTNIEPMLFDPNDHEVIYGADCNSLVISTNAGNTWSRIDPLPGYSIVDVRLIGTMLLVLGINPVGTSALSAVDVTDPHTPEAGGILLTANGKARMDATRELIVVAGAGSIHTSSDGGQTWSETEAMAEVDPVQTPPAGATAAGNPLGNVLSLRIGPSKIKRLYAGTAAGLIVSQDDGLTWVRYDGVSATAIVTEIQFGLANADLYVTTDPGVIMVPAP